MAASETAVAWARWGMISGWLARLWRPQTPPLLILSFPRSGSSWVGETLGTAANALYLREPITQGHPALVDIGTVLPLVWPEVRQIYRRLADKAFAGWPDFGNTIVRSPSQWALRERRQRRVVVKEVNPFACDWYLRRYHPRLVLLLRHPAAVTWSSYKMGWLGATPAEWAGQGEFQGAALRAVHETLAGYQDYTVVHYETLCREPVAGFQSLCNFAGLTWDEGIQAFIAETTTSTSQPDPRHLRRDSRRMADSWRDQVAPDLLDALRASYRQFDLPWYCQDADW